MASLLAASPAAGPNALLNRGTVTSQIAYPTPAVPSVPPPPSGVPTSPGTFTGSAPSSSPYGAFTAPDPSSLANDPYTQFRIAQGSRAIQRGAAARGTLLTGGLQNRLQQSAQEMASEEAQNAFNRSLAGYTANRDTNAQNFDQQMGTFNANLGAFGANTNATLGYDRLAQDATYGNYDRAYGAGQDAANRTDRTNLINADNNAAAAQTAQQAADDWYARQVEATRQQNEALSDFAARPTARTGFVQPVFR